MPATNGAATWRLEQNSLPSIEATDARQSSPAPPISPAQTTNTKMREQTNSTTRPRSCPTPSPGSVQPSRPPASAGVTARRTAAPLTAPAHNYNHVLSCHSFSLGPMSHLQFYRATLSRDKIASVTCRVAHCNFVA